MAITIGIVALVFFLALGMPVAFALCVSGSIGLIWAEGIQGMMTILITSPFRTAASFILITVPMFILMAEIASIGGLAKELFVLALRWVGHLPGGLAMATMVANAGFGAMSGSSTAAAATMSRIAIPEMLNHGYNRVIASGTVAMGGTLAIMIPPSVPLVVYGITTETPIGKLLIAGILPGILTTIFYCFGIYLWVKLKPELVRPIRPFSWRQRWEALKGLIPFLCLVLIVIGGMYSGLATPSEVAALGALGSLIICVVMRRIDFRGFVLALERTVKATSMIFAIIIGAMIFGYFSTVTGSTQKMIESVGTLAIPPWAILFVLIIIYIILGCFMDQMAILLLTLPLTFPLVVSLGYNPIWFGIIITALVEIGLVTPPFGMNVYVVGTVSGIPLHDIFKGAIVFLIFEGVAFIFLLFFPIISLFLPSLMR